MPSGLDMFSILFCTTLYWQSMMSDDFPHGEKVMYEDLPKPFYSKSRIKMLRKFSSYKFF